MSQMHVNGNHLVYCPKVTPLCQFDNSEFSIYPVLTPLLKKERGTKVTWTSVNRH